MPLTLNPPYVKENRRSSVDTSLVLPKRRNSFVTKRKTYHLFPTFSFENVWRGASEIIAEFLVTSLNSTSLLSAFRTPPANVKFCPCIAWKTGPDTIVRYKLWKDIGEILYVPLYSGQTISTTYSIEIWNTNNPIISGGGYRLDSSILVIPTSFCDSSDIELTLNYQNCTDVTFDLSDYVPLGGDYYLVVGNCGEADLIKGSSITKDFLLLQSTDGTWHKVNLQTQTDLDGETFLDFYIDQSNEAPDDLPYFCFRSNEPESYRVDLSYQVDALGGTHKLNISSGASDDVGYNVVMLKNLTDAQYYSVRILYAGGEVKFTFI